MEEPDSESEPFAMILTVSSYVSLVLYTTFFIYMLIKLKGRLFIGLGSILYLYQIFFILSAVLSTMFLYYKENNLFDETSIFFKYITFFNCFNSIITRIKWFILYYLTMQMKFIVIKLKSETLIEYKKEMKSWNIKQFLIYIVFSLLAASIVIVSTIRDINEV